MSVGERVFGREFKGSEREVKGERMGLSPDDFGERWYFWMF